MLNEFDIIEKYFYPLATNFAEVRLGMGDDAAILQPPNGSEIVSSIDTYNVNVHFPENAKAYDIATRVIAASISDLAAMGATPRWVSLALTLPTINESWLQQFSRGLKKSLLAHQLSLIGGNMTAGTLGMTLHVMGFIKQGQGLTRRGAKIGDGIYLSGEIGGAFLGLQIALEKISAIIKNADKYLAAFYQPQSCISLGQTLVNIANSAIDISDGLLSDLNHLVKQSHCHARLQLENIPIVSGLTDLYSYDEALGFALNHGDDYQLCFTVPKAAQALLPPTCFHIGEIIAGEGISLYHRDNLYSLPIKGYQHF